MTWREETEAAREAFAQGCGSLSMTVEPCETRGTWAEEARGARSYRVRLSFGLAVWEGPYSVGSGVALSAAVAALDRGERPPGLRATDRAADVRRLAGPFVNTIAGSELADRLRDAYRPDVSDVVGALFLDVSGWEPDNGLRDWIDSTGFEWTHPADAVEAFEACRRAARFLRNAFGDGARYDRMAELASEI